jgi:hypothetical protein
MSPWPMKSAVIRKIIWLLPPIARAVVPTHPMVLGCERFPLSNQLLVK